VEVVGPPCCCAMAAAGRRAADAPAAFNKVRLEKGE